MIRVLHVIASLHFGGSQAFVMNLYQNIDREKIQFDFVVIPEEKKDLYEVVEKMGGRIYVMPRYNVWNHFTYVKWWNDFFSAHDEYKIIHAHVRSTAAIFLSIAKKYSLITISHSHSTSNGKGVAALVKNIMQLPIRNIADYFFACSNEAGKWLFGEKVTKQVNYRVIPNGICIDKFKFDVQKRNFMRAKLGLSPNDFLIGHVGRFVKAKNHEFLIKVFAEYSKINDNARLLLVGDGELASKVKEQCDELGISKKVIFAGSKFNTEDFYQAMDVFVFPSLWEGLGIVAIEAQANGLPCLVSDKIPREALVTKNIIALSLDRVDEWINILKILKVEVNRNVKIRDLENLIYYDMSTVSNNIQKFYLSKVFGG